MKSPKTLMSEKLFDRSALALVLTFSFSPVQAELTPTAYTMSVIENHSEARDVLRGEYSRVTESRDTSTTFVGNSFSMQTNLCVAYTKTGEFDSAKAACETAVELTRKSLRRSRHQQSISYSQRSYRRDLALALSNRGVLRVFSGEAEMAQQDFIEANRLKSGLSQPSTNLSILIESPVS